MWRIYKPTSSHNSAPSKLPIVTSKSGSNKANIPELSSCTGGGSAKVCFVFSQIYSEYALD